MKSLAIVGTGVAGMACAYFLRNHFDVQVFERNSYIGGHTNTLSVQENDSTVHIDTGFMVYNEVTYPNLTRLFQKLEVETMPTSMSFSVQHRPTGLEFAGTGIDGLFAQRRRILSPSYYRLIYEINRFNQTCAEILDNPKYESYTLAAYLSEKGFSQSFADRYLVPMSSAVWSTPPDRMLDFPATTLVRFFKNHGFLGLNCQHPWRTVVGGSRVYRDRIVSSLGNRFHTHRAITSIHRGVGKVQLGEANGSTLEFDKVIVATHGDEALKLLADASPLEQELLSEFHYQTNIATLHTDPAVMPRAKRAWCSWNYRTDLDSGGRQSASTVYWMNRLQNVSKKVNYFVSIEDPGLIDPAQVIRRIEYTHPLFSTRTDLAQKKLHRLNENGSTFFCGSYFKYGFHEDALASALAVCAALRGGDPWA